MGDEGEVRSRASALGILRPEPQKEYTPEEMRRALGEDELPRDAITVHHSFGFDSVKRNNLHYLSDEVIIFTVGAMVQTVHLATGEQTYLYGVDGGGIGFVAVHPEKTHFALGEKGVNPGVYVYETETLKLKRVLVGGTERAYSCGRFSDDGSKLATVGGYPDYWLTVWDWREEAVVLRSKAFSQEVFDVTFSPFFEGQLTTSGAGHIRFWKMAETFTGLKLQGDIGRFGNEDLSDVAGYAEMPDGKVLSGTESGRLLMWDGGLIRVVLLRPGGRPCHDGMIEIVRLDAESGRVYTAGTDGYVRVWDYETLNNAEPGEDSAESCVDALDEFLVPRGEPLGPQGSLDPIASEPASVKSLIVSQRDHWLVQDEKGGVVKVPLTASGAPDVRNARRVLDFHAGAVRALEASRVSDHVITAGEDGSVRVFAYAEKRQVFAARFDAPATALSLAPPAVDEEGRVAIVGFGDGVARALLRCADAWKLVDAVKPHVGAVTCAAYAPAARAGARPLLATAGEDKKVWFFSCEREKGTGLNPVGFVEAPGPVSALAWTDSGDAALVGCASGHIVEVAAPAAGSVDATRTFKFEPRRVRAYAFERPRASVASALAARERAPAEIGRETDPADVVEAKAARECFDERAAELQEEMDEAEATATYPVTHLAYDGGNAHVFELCVGGEARGKVFTCSLERPGKPLAARDVHAESVVTVVKTRQGASGDVDVSGAENGEVRVSRRGFEKHWRWQVHDGHRGAVSGAAVSRCGTFLITAAKDGSLFVQTLGPELRGSLGGGAADGEPRTADVAPSVEADAMPTARDVDSATACAIEDAKVKAEEDAERAAAEERKMGVRELLAKLKAEYAALKRENDVRPAAERLPSTAFEVDLGLREVIEAETLAALERATASLAWRREKASLGLRKLRERFLDDIEHERVVLRSFATGRRAFAATSFRVTKPNEKIEADLKALKEGGARLGPDRAAGGPRRVRSSRAGSDAGGSARHSRSQNARSDPSKPVCEEENPFAAGHKQELRRRRRLAREEEWRRFNATKPDDAYENPEDVAAIEVAKRTLGDYKLKSDERFVDAEEDSMNYGKKRHQMLLLEASTREARRDFNARFAAMRETRAAVVRDVVAGAARVAEITAALGDAHTPEGAAALAAVGEPFRATPLADEYPTEARDETTEEALRAFDAARRAAAAEAAAEVGAEAGTRFGGGFRGGGGGENAGKEESVEKSAEGEPIASETDPGAARNGDGDGDGYGAAPSVAATEEPRANGEAAAARAPSAAASSAAFSVPREDETDLERAASVCRLRHERAALVRKRLELPARFDEALRALRRHKSFVEGELKAAEIKQLTYNRELASLKKFEDGEASLREKLSLRYAEQEGIERKSRDARARVEDVEAELDEVDERKRKVLNEFDTFVHEEHPRREYLRKIFLRRIKRVKRKDPTDDARDEGDRPEFEESDGDDDSDDDDDEYDSDDEMEESRPEDCDESLWEKILALRERRQDQDDVLNELAKRSAELKKEADVLAKRDKAAGKALALLREEMSLFQREKQETMNMIETTVPLRLRQVEYLCDGKLPLRLSEGVVFSRSNLEGLRARIDALVREKASLRATQRDLRREHAALRRDTAALAERNRALDDAATRMTMLRFGKRIDLEKMERALIPKKGIEELKVSLRKTETAHRRELRRWDADLAEARRELTRATAENTAVLNAVSDLTQRKRELEVRLKRLQKSVFVDPDAGRCEEAAERERMAAVVDARAAEIDTLRREIGFLSVKGTPSGPGF